MAATRHRSVFDPGGLRLRRSAVPAESGRVTVTPPHRGVQGWSSGLPSGWLHRCRPLGVSDDASVASGDA